MFAFFYPQALYVGINDKELKWIASDLVMINNCQLIILCFFCK